MSRSFRIHENRSKPRIDWWRWVLVACATLILCSCRGVGPGGMLRPDADAVLPIASAPPTPYPALPRQAFTGGPVDGYTQPGIEELSDQAAAGVESGAELAEPWAPPGIERPWPKDEYLRDGGDSGPAVGVGADWTVRGLGLEDTIVHYDTLDGRTVVEPSNRVDIYSPRFAAVRKVKVVVQEQQQQKLAGVNLPVRLSLNDERQEAATAVQPLQPVGETGERSPNLFRERLRGVGLEGAQALSGLNKGFMPYENLEVIRHGAFLQSEKARLAQATQAALAWTTNKAVQVVIDSQQAATAVSDSRAQLAYRYELPPGKPRMRVVKVASKQEALPGEVIDFTIRFDNVGDEPVGNVTIIDNLTTRLEYVADTAQSSLKADFFTQRNEGDSLVLRWEIIDPIKPGDGGVIRFQCRVR